jgi:hypothetical protein
MVDADEYSWAQAAWDRIVSHSIDPNAPVAGRRLHYQRLMQQLAEPTFSLASSAVDYEFRVSSGIFDFPDDET